MSAASAKGPGLETTPIGLSDAEVDALKQTINEEYLARGTHEFVLDEPGPDVAPSSRIPLSEQQHVDA